MPEGNSFTNLLKLMKTQGYNKDVTITVGAVQSPNPLQITLDSIVLDEDDFTKTQTVQDIVDGVAPSDPMKVGDKVLMLVDGSNFYIIDRVVG